MKKTFYRGFLLEGEEFHQTFNKPEQIRFLTTTFLWRYCQSKKYHFIKKKEGKVVNELLTDFSTRSRLQWICAVSEFGQNIDASA